MLNILNGSQAAKLDKITIENGTASEVLIERAANAVIDYILSELDEVENIFLVAGPGNNGADAVKMHSILKENGKLGAEILLLKETEEEAFTAYKNSIENSDLIVDAIFGTGLNRDVEGKYAAAIEMINRYHAEGKKVLSVDIPSGINSDDGRVMGVAVEADYCVVIEHLKYGHVLYPGRAYCGETETVAIGLDLTACNENDLGLTAFAFERADVKKYLPVRMPDSNKGSYGRQLIIAGSDFMPGAAVLAAKAAYRTGSGHVTVCSGERTLMQVVNSVPEVILLSDEVQPDYGLYDSVVIGPGLSRSENTVRKMKSVMDFTITSIMTRRDGNGMTVFIIDADGINILAEEMDKKRIIGPEKRLRYLRDELPESTVFTPHKKELSRLLDIPMEELKKSLTDVAEMISKHSTQIFVLKDAATIVVSKGRKYVNMSGNDGLSTAGAGDVLTGIIASFTAKTTGAEDLFIKTCLAVYIHGLAGERVSKRFSTYGVLAGDLPKAAAKCLADIIRGW